MKPPGLIECIVIVAYLSGLVSIVIDGRKRRDQLSRTGYVIRVYGGSFLAIVALLGIVLQVWLALR
jgi:hypothetical protein